MKLAQKLALSALIGAAALGQNASAQYETDHAVRKLVDALVKAQQAQDTPRILEIKALMQKFAKERATAPKGDPWAAVLTSTNKKGIEASADKVMERSKALQELNQRQVKEADSLLARLDSKP